MRERESVYRSLLDIKKIIFYESNVFVHFFSIDLSHVFFFLFTRYDYPVLSCL